MKEKFLEEVVTKYVDELAKESGKLFDDLYDEGLQFVNIYIRNYLEKYRLKYQSIKTLLRGNTPVYLYDVYFPLKLKTEKVIISTTTTKNLFSKSNCVTIIGDAGSGKSTLVKHLFLDCIASKFGIPILIELRYFNNLHEASIEDYLKKEIFENNLVINNEILNRYLGAGKFVFFLDGFDEINQDIMQKIIKELLTFINKYSENKFILTTRPYSNIEMLNNFFNFHVCELEASEVKEFIKIQLKDDAEIANKIIDSVDENKQDYLKSFLSNPLLLTLYILTYQSNPSVPDQKYIFYRRVFNALFSEHDSKTKFAAILAL